MPIQNPQSSAAFQSNILQSLQNTGLTQLNPGGKARAFCDIAGSEMGSLELRSYAALGQTLLPFATQDNLDFLGEIYGVPRLDGQTAYSAVSDGNLQFYVRTGTFGAINAGRDIIIPPGTVISTGVPNGPIYTTDSAVTLPASSSSISFSATCTSDGASGNVASGALTSHNFQGYTDFRFGTLLVTNNFGIVTGSDIESDDNYRYRISLKLGSKNGAAEADLRLAILNVPGIQDLVFVRQAGTYICYVYASSPVVPTGVMQMVQNQMNQATAWPIVGRAAQPDLIGISLATTLTFVAGATSSQQQAAISNATAAAENYLNNLSVGQTMVINQVADRILSADQNILTIGTPNQPLSGIYIWRSREDGSRYSRFLVNDYQPQTGERLGVESSIVNPINLTVAA